MMAVIVALCLLVLIYEIQEWRLNNKLIALLGILIAMNAILRFMDMALPLFGGFSPVFFLIILTGYVFGGRMGFLMGTLTMLVSALITGGVGPWLPNQMFTAGWVGMSAFLIRRVVLWSKIKNPQFELLLLALFGFGWGFGFGAITNLWFWPFIAGPQNQSFSASQTLMATLKNYGVYYAATSAFWDLGRAVGNVVMMWVFGHAALKALRRFQTRFNFSYQAAEEEVG
jgi:energy-coupling factor transport system substrate-specific component